MEHEVFVPVAAERLREVLADPVRVARAVPGLQQDAGAEPVAGRLKVRVAGHTITYRGAARVSAREDGSYAVEGDATEARGTGSVKLALTVWVREAEGGSGATVRFEGSASADGRVAEFPAEAVEAAVGRLLNRFGEQLGTVADQERDRDADGTPADETADRTADETADEGLAPGEFETRVTSDFETTPDADDAAAPEPGPEAGAPVEAGGGAGAGAGDAAGEPPVAEAAHARRTMIGRSAEEVDHAPPRGRYAPVPAPQTVVPSSALRWAAPAAAVVLASAIVVSRVIRRRR
ncbi:SRPBCC domain-containing protein [Streptomyces sp. AC550_RSS872]|uniref:SRPBCC domain-containing protein n=1 Tax=Streptomyces sp. AC550_RSS872 TaxID=2823689 RepID=UPI001C25372F|nr:SRPBCC domain-containing protein [Streptomyces sp. AC550_RSS872]